MFAVRIHGRGGQGVVTAAELLSVAAFEEGRHAQAFPSFGSERTGAPVVAFCRIADTPIRVREPILEPDAVLVQDPTLLRQVDVFAGLAPGGWAIVNTTRAADRARPRTGSTRGVRDRARRRDRAPPPRPGAAGRAAAGRPRRRARTSCRWRASPPPTATASRDPVGEGNAAAAREAFEFVRAELGAPVRAEADRGLAGGRGGRRAVPARGDRRLPHLAADPHRGGAVGAREGRDARPVRVRQRRVGVRRHVRVHRRLGRGRAHLHGDGQPGPALHERGGLQRVRASACRSS